MVRSARRFADLGGVPEEHRTDSLSAAFKNLQRSAEADLTEEFFAQFGKRVPPAMNAELASLRYRLRTV